MLCCLLPMVISWSFPTDVDTNRISHFQAIAGLRGLATHDIFRSRIIEERGLEPLFFTLSTNKAEIAPKSQKEASICFFNLTCASLKNYSIIKSGILEILSSVLSSDEKHVRAYAFASLKNLAEIGTVIQDRILDNDCWYIVMKFMSRKFLNCEAHHEAARLFTLLSTCRAIRISTALDRHSLKYLIIKLSRMTCFCSVVVFLLLGM